MAVNMVVEPNPPQGDLDAVSNGLLEFNLSRAGDPQRSRLGGFLRDETGKIIGGLNATIAYKWLHVDTLWLSEQLRGTGWGAKLLRAAEEYGRQNGCVAVWLDTFSFQAPGFYRKQGYTEYGRLEDFPPGHTRYFFVKKL